VGQRITFLLLLASFSCLGQNLVPNPGFELHSDEGVSSWMQPPEPYYHYEDSSIGDSHEGAYYNGLCMYNHDICEYMSIKLNDALYSGQTYCMSFWVRLAKFKAVRFTMNEGLGVYFSNKKVMVDRKVYLYEKPQVYMQFDLMDDRFVWMKMECTYTAMGGEKYITIGNFFNEGESIPMTEGQQEVARKLSAAKDTRDELLVESMAAIEQKYPKVTIDYSDPMREYSKKEMKEFDRQKQSVRNRMVEEELVSNDIQVDYDRKIQALTNEFASIPLPFFYLRYYFDEVSLVPIEDPSTCACEDKIELEVGVSFKLKNILFETAKADLRTESFTALKSLINVLKDNPTMKILIKGHTDNIGGADHNLILSKNRAKAVLEYLVSKKIDPERLSFEGFGDTKPVADNGSDGGRKMNRRVEVEILAK
jgi:outer membrane protein OmpA-like peptidoglycan-associated protein